MNSMDKIIDLPKVFRSSIELYKKNFQFFIPLSLFYGIFNLAVRQIANNLFKDPKESVFFIGIISTLILCRVAIMFIYSSSRFRFGVSLDFSKAFDQSKGKYLRYVTVYLSMLFLMGIGFLFFVIPGLIVGTLFMFADIMIVLENRKYTEAFKESFSFVKQRFWIVLQFFIVLTTISLTPILFIQLFQNVNIGLTRALIEIFSVAFIPFYIISQVQFYYILKESN